MSVCKLASIPRHIHVYGHDGSINIYTAMRFLYLVLTRFLMGGGRELILWPFSRLLVNQPKITMNVRIKQSGWNPCSCKENAVNTGFARVPTISASQKISLDMDLYLLTLVWPLFFRSRFLVGPPSTRVYCTLLFEECTVYKYKNVHCYSCATLGRVQQDAI